MIRCASDRAHGGVERDLAMSTSFRDTSTRRLDRSPMKKATSEEANSNEFVCYNTSTGVVGIYLDVACSVGERTPQHDLWGVRSSVPPLVYCVRHPKRPGGPAELAEKNKFSVYQNRFRFPDSANVKLVPFVLETYGTMGKHAQELITWIVNLAYPLVQVGRDQLEDLDGRQGAAYARAYGRIAAALAHGNGCRATRWRDQFRIAAANAKEAARLAAAGQTMEE